MGKNKDSLAGIEARQTLIKEVNSRMLSTGMTREELVPLYNSLVAPGWTVSDFIEASFDAGEMEWRDDKLVPTERYLNS